MKQSLTIHREVVISSHEKNPRESIRRAAIHLGLSYTTVHDSLKEASYKLHRPYEIQTLNQEDYWKCVTFQDWVLNKMKHSPEFVKLLLFSDNAIFHLERSVIWKSSHWAKRNSNWTVEKSLNSSRVLMWAALSSYGVIEPNFFDGNINAVSYLQMIEAQFYPQILALNNSSQIIFRQDVAPSNWAPPVRVWLNDNMPNRWIGRGNPDNQHIPWPLGPQISPHWIISFGGS